MEHHNGSIELTSDVGQGTEAIVVFPAELVVLSDESVRLPTRGPLQVDHTSDCRIESASNGLAH
jgi:hypothetical protein